MIFYNAFLKEQEFLEKYKEDEILFTGDASYIYKEIIEEIMGSKAKFINKARVFPRAGILAERAVDLEEVNSVILEPYYHSKTQAEREKELKSF